MMRITFVLPPPDLSGGIRVLAVYAERLLSRGHDVRIVATRPRHPTLRQMARAVFKHGRWPFGREKLASHFDGSPVPVKIVGHSGPIRASEVPDADVVVATWWETAMWINEFPDSKGAKVHFMQDYEVYFAPPDKVDAACRLPMPKIVLTSWMRDLLRERFDIEPLAMVPNSVDLTVFNSPPRQRCVVPTVGTVYARAHNKGTDVCIRAVEIARRPFPELRFRAVANVPPIPSLPLPPDTELSVRVRDAEIRDAYASCDAWLFGTRQEGFGMPLLEAMACRTPVIATPGGAAPDIVPMGGGVLVPHDDAEAMAREIVRICTLPDQDWRQLSEEARRVVASYTWDDATLRFEEALTKVMAEPVGPRIGRVA